MFYQSARAPGDEDHSPLQYEDSRSRPDDMFAGRQLKELVEATLARLSPQYRQVLILREFEGRSYEEIAEIAGCNLGAVKSRLHRARACFAALITPYLD